MSTVGWIVVGLVGLVVWVVVSVLVAGLIGAVIRASRGDDDW